MYTLSYVAPSAFSSPRITTLARRFGCTRSSSPRAGRRAQLQLRQHGAHDLRHVQDEHRVGAVAVARRRLALLCFLARRLAAAELDLEQVVAELGVARDLLARHDADDAADRVARRELAVLELARAGADGGARDGEALELPDEQLVRRELRRPHLAPREEGRALQRRRRLAAADAVERHEVHAGARPLPPAEQRDLARRAAPRPPQPAHAALAQPLRPEVRLGAHLELAVDAVRAESRQSR